MTKSAVLAIQCLIRYSENQCAFGNRRITSATPELAYNRVNYPFTFDPSVVCVTTANFADDRSVTRNLLPC
jgi:hypothetical protein